MKFFSKKKFIQTIFLLVFFILFPFQAFDQEPSSLQDKQFQNQFQIDVLVFSPHPDDETLCCGGTIIKAIKEKKTVNPVRNFKSNAFSNTFESKISNGVKVVFLTNGDGFGSSASLLFKKKLEELTAKDYIQLGKERQKEAIGAGKMLGLKEDDLIFLGYPDAELSFLYEKFYKDYYLSETTNTTSSPYELTYPIRNEISNGTSNQAKYGYTKENLISDLKKLLEKYKPKKIFLPHILDNHKDHQATNKFVSFALDELKTDPVRNEVSNGAGENQDWLSSLEVFYYLIHNPNYRPPPSFSTSWPDEKGLIIEEPADFSERAKENINISDVKTQKAEALKKYDSQLLVPEEEKLFENFSNKENEIFWKISKEQKEKILDLEEEWEVIGNRLRNNGYNINFAPVADVADDIQDLINPLTRKERIFSQDPETVSQLVSAIVKGSNKAGITPVVKHFPGLGAAKTDTHAWLPTVNLSKEEIFQTHLLPYQTLLKEKSPFWIMMGHGVYPSLSKEPASLSFEIQTGILRKEMGFEGIIISDELWVMGALREYAKREGLKQPFIGELVIRAFQAGTDIVILYLPPPEADKIVFNVIKAVKKAVKEGRLKEEEIDKSLERILGEKERIFNKPFKNLIKGMSLQEKIGQKIMIDIWGKENIGLLKKYNVGGIRPYGNVEIIKKIQKTVKIPLFTASQHEGGMVTQSQPDIFTKNAYLTGKEFEEIIKREEKLPKNFINEEDIFESLPEGQKEQVFKGIIDFLDEAIIRMSPHSGFNPYYDPIFLLFDLDKHLELKSYRNLPVDWFRKFPDEKTAIVGYQVLKEIFIAWQENRKSGKVKIGKDLISQVKSLKEMVETEALKIKKFRILSLSTHPDDEDNEGLAYFKYKFDAETYILLATRGEGGENEISSLLYDDLGRLRTEEIEKAGEILGVTKVYYLGLEDFGYCNLEKEALEKWDREEALKKLIYFYRLIKPHIIITENTRTDEHCQHKVFVSLALEAFEKAADPKIYPEMLKEGLPIWQPLKFYQRTFEQDGISIALEERDSLTGKTYKEIALEALKQHRTQGFGECSSPSAKIFYRLVKSKVENENNSFFSGIKKTDLEQGNLVPTQKGERKVLPSGVSGIKIINGISIGLFEPNNNILFTSLKTLGYDFTQLTQENLGKQNLNQFDVILIGQGVFNNDFDSSQITQNLLEFVKKGGKLIVFPQFNRELKLFSLAPYPFKISFKPVSKDSLIEILMPENRLFYFPNKITSQDFDDWQQQKGLYFPFDYGKEYLDLTRTVSLDGNILKSGYILASYGNGNYIYTGYDWERQLRNFHKGALKNLANMIAYQLPY